MAHGSAAAKDVEVVLEGWWAVAEGEVRVGMEGAGGS